MAGLQDEQKKPQQAVLKPSGGINRLPNAPQDNPLAQVDPALRHAALVRENQQVQAQRDRANAQKAQSALMQRQSPEMQAFAQDQQQRQQTMNAALSANGGSLNPQQARAALAGQPVQNALSQLPQAQAQPSWLSRAAGYLPRMQGIRDGLSQLDATKQSLGLPTEGVLSPTNSRAVVDDIIGRKGEPLAQSAAQQASAAAGQAALAQTTALSNPQNWGKTAYGDNIVGRQTDDGYAFSNAAADVQAAGNSRFKGRGGADGRISNNGSFNVMKSQDMWRSMGGNPLAQPPATPARYGNAERLADGLQDIRSSGVNVVRSGADERNARLKTQWREDDAIRAAGRDRRGVNHAAVAAAAARAKATAEMEGMQSLTRARHEESAAERASRERMNQGRQGLERAQAASLEQQTQSAQQAEQARQQQMQRLQQMQALMTDPSASPQQRQAAKQFVDMATFNKDYFTKLKGADNEYGSGGEALIDLRSGQPVYGGQGLGQGEAGMQALDKNTIYTNAIGQVTQWDENRGRWITSNPQ